MTPNTRKQLQRRLRDEEGQTLVEYALIIMLVATALVASLGLLADGLADFYDSVASVFAGFGGS
jgi:Flp pilus assembly pilin Flp